MEALAGFGTPVAITSVMLIALGFKPIMGSAARLNSPTSAPSPVALSTRQGSGRGPSRRRFGMIVG